MTFCDCDSTNAARNLKMDIMEAWCTTEWQPRFPGQPMQTVLTSESCTNEYALGQFDKQFILGGQYRYAGYSELQNNVLPHIDHTERDGKINQRTGIFIFRFVDTAGIALEVPILCAHYADNGYYFVTLACIPTAFLLAWTDFEKECERLHYARTPSDRVIVVGGRYSSFKPTVDWDDIVLPEALKAEILNDMQSFFARGVGIYKRLNLKPFRKLLLAGAPGTGKTILCAALAKIALAQDCLVIYVSSAERRQGDDHGSKFEKVQYALEVASSSEYPALILLEEMDAYLQPEEKAVILNVLDGSESIISDHGVLMIATTNYPEAIDERVLKRPGRLDRIFIIPETRTPQDAATLLRQYLGSMWREEHVTLVSRLVGYPGAFIREVAIHALTHIAYADMNALPLEMLEQSFSNLKDQLEARDEFLLRRLNIAENNGNGAHEGVNANGNSEE
jgi:hypothetical protein